MEKTAVEWFFDNLKNHEIQAEHFELYQQAKAMEKNQILNTWYACKLSIIDRDGMSIEDYYNKTYTN
jgi:hypothetical protein